MKSIRPTVVEYVKILATSNSCVGMNGHLASEDNPPEYILGNVIEVRQVGAQFCCSEMSDHFSKGDIAFGSRSEEVYRNKIAEVFIRVEGGAQNLTREGKPPKEGSRSEFPGASTKPKPNTDIPLAYCPWCQQPVMTLEVATI